MFEGSVTEMAWSAVNTSPTRLRCACVRMNTDIMDKDVDLGIDMYVNMGIHVLSMSLAGTTAAAQERSCYAHAAAPTTLRLRS